jgi:hypothetical protein
MSIATRPGFVRRLLRSFWRAATACLMAGMAFGSFVPPPPPPPPPPVEIREAGGQSRLRSRRAR